MKFRRRVIFRHFKNQTFMNAFRKKLEKRHFWCECWHLNFSYSIPEKFSSTPPLWFKWISHSKWFDRMPYQFSMFSGTEEKYQFEFYKVDEVSWCCVWPIYWQWNYVEKMYYKIEAPDVLKWIRNPRVISFLIFVPHRCGAAYSF